MIQRRHRAPRRGLRSWQMEPTGMRRCSIEHEQPFGCARRRPRGRREHPAGAQLATVREQPQDGEVLPPARRSSRSVSGSPHHDNRCHHHDGWVGRPPRHKSMEPRIWTSLGDRLGTTGRWDGDCDPRDGSQGSPWLSEGELTARRRTGPAMPRRPPWRMARGRPGEREGHRRHSLWRSKRQGRRRGSPFGSARRALPAR